MRGTRGFMIVALVMVLAVSAQAGVIYDIWTGVYTSGDLMPVIEDVVVTYADDEGGRVFFLVSEIPSGVHRGIIVFPDSPLPEGFSVASGDLITITGANCGIGDRVNLDLHWDKGAAVIKTGTVDIPWNDLTFTDIINGENHYGWEWAYCPLHLTEGFTVTYGGGGYCVAISADSGYYHLSFSMDNDPIPFTVGDCFQGARGVWDPWDGVLYVPPGGITLLDCALPVENSSFGRIKATYR